MASLNISYKSMQQDFVSNLNGTSTIEIAAVVSSAPLGVLLRNVSVGWLFSGGRRQTGMLWYRYVLDFLVLIFPALLCFTLAADHTPLVLTTLVSSICGSLFIAQRLSAHRRTAAESKIDWSILANTAVSGKRPFVTNFRAFVNIAAAISILAVDFPVFPRRFCKTETFGTGLMDIGVGAFIVSNAIVSPEARGKTLGRRSFLRHLVDLWNAVQSSIPLLVLGVIRMASVKATNYQEHVSEYGVHWNFFFTLAFVKVFATLLLTLSTPAMSWVLGVAVASGYQYILTGKNWQKFALHGADGHDSRSNLIDANREGLFSCMGYLAIYLAGVSLGSYLFNARVKLKEWAKTCLYLVILDAFFWFLLWYAQDHGHPVSRRLANFSFVIWMMAYNIQVLASFLLVDLICIVLSELGISLKPAGQGRTAAQEDCCLLKAINRNGLFFFLLCNLLTGLVNFSMATIHAPTGQAFAVLIAYLSAVSFISAILHHFNITLKFW